MPARSRRVQDEDTFVVPGRWRRLVHPRRGGIAGPAIESPADPWAAVNDLLDLDCNRHDGKPYRDYLARILGHPDGDPAVAQAAESYLDNEPTTPLGAAAVAGAAAAAYWTSYPAASSIEQFVVFADHWVAAHGVVFAARAAAHLGGFYIGTGRRTNRAWDDRDFIRPLSTEDESRLPQVRWHIVVERVRAHLAACSDTDYAAAVEALAGHRHGTLTERIVTSYLAATRADWTDRDCADRATIRDNRQWGLRDWLLVAAVTSADQLAAIADKITGWAILTPRINSLYGTTLFPTIVEGVGPDAAHTFERWFRNGYAKADTRKKLMSAIAEFPTDVAFGLLLKHAGHRDAGSALSKAIKRYPDRAARLLQAMSASDDRNALLAKELLDEHLTT